MTLVERDSGSHLLSLCVRLPQWSSASSPSSRRPSTTLWKFTTGRLSIPGFSALSLVPTQVGKHEKAISVSSTAVYIVKLPNAIRATGDYTLTSEKGAGIR